MPALPVQRLLLIAGLLVSDALVLLLSFRVAYSIRFGLRLTVAPEVAANPAQYNLLALVLVPVWLAAFAVFRLYDPRAKRGGIQESARAFHACTTSTVLVVVATFLQPAFVVSRTWLVSAWVLSFLGIAASRFAARRVVYALRGRGYLLSPALIVGTNEEAAGVTRFLSDSRSSGVRVLGAIRTARDTASAIGSIPVLGGLEDIEHVTDHHHIEDVIVAISAVSREELLTLCEGLEPRSVHLRLSSGLYDLLTTRIEVSTLGTLPLMTVHKNRLDPSELLLKRTVETVIAAFALGLLSPLLLLLAILVRRDSPGPVFHRRRVLGPYGRPFDAFKFRTMHVDGDTRLQHLAGAADMLRTEHKLRVDPRVTRVGQWLRRYSLDELPQLLNVVRGEMALVGPRMITAEEAAKYGRQRMNLLAVKPGLTGLWQVSGRSDLTYEERVRLDMYYVKHYSIWLDLQILLIETLPAVLRGRGAY